MQPTPPGTAPGRAGHAQAQSALKRAGHVVEHMQELNPRTFLVDTTQDRYVVKAPPPDPRQSRLYARVTLAWERAIMQTLQDVSPRLAHIPRLLEVTEPDVIVMQWIPGETAPPLDPLERMRILVEFHTLPIRPRMPRWTRPWWRLMVLRGPVYLRRRLGAVKRHRGRKGALRCSRVLARLNLQQPTLDIPFHSHGDPHMANLKRTPDGKLYWLDFESVHPERRWVLDDVVYRSFAWKHFRWKPDKKDLPATYLRALHERHPDLRLDAKTQMRAALIHRAVINLYNAKRKNLDEMACFLDEILLDDASYHEWYREHAQSFEEVAKETGWASTPA